MPTPSNADASFYLQFVATAYQMYDTYPTQLTPPATSDMPAGYSIVTYMTSTDPVSGDQVFFGFIATPDAGTAGPGILAIRGTDNPYEWLTDFDALPTPFPPIPNAYVATGFYEFVTGIQWYAADGTALVADHPVDADAYPDGFVIVGHSLGGSMAVLLMATWRTAIPSLLLTLVTAAAPAVGDAAFLQGFSNCAGEASFRFINELDTIASTFDLLYYQVPVEIPLFSLDIIVSPICEHELATYFYLLSPAGTQCTSDCCLFDDPGKQRLAAVVAQKHALRRTVWHAGVDDQRSAAASKESGGDGTVAGSLPG